MFPRAPRVSVRCLGGVRPQVGWTRRQHLISLLTATTLVTDIIKVECCVVLDHVSHSYEREGSFEMSLGVFKQIKLGSFDVKSEFS